MDATATTPPAENKGPGLARVVEDALDASWDVVVENYPLAETGDLSP